MRRFLVGERRKLREWVPGWGSVWFVPSPPFRAVWGGSRAMPPSAWAGVFARCGACARDGVVRGGVGGSARVSGSGLGPGNPDVRFGLFVQERVVCGCSARVVCPGACGQCGLFVHVRVGSALRGRVGWCVHGSALRHGWWVRVCVGRWVQRGLYATELARGQSGGWLGLRVAGRPACTRLHVTVAGWWAGQAGPCRAGQQGGRVCPVRARTRSTAQKSPGRALAGPPGASGVVRY